MIGQYLRSKGDNASGLEYFFKAIPLAQQSKDQRRLNSIYFDMATIYFNLRNHEEYEIIIRKGGENMPDKSHPRYDILLAQYQRGRATFFVLNHQPDSALEYAQPLITTSHRIGSQLYLFNAYFLNAAIQDQSGDKEMAALYFKKALANSVVASAYSQLRFASIYIPYLLRNKNFAEAKQQALLLLNGFASGNNNLKLTGAGYLRQIFDSIGRTDSAYYFAKEEIRINDVIFGTNHYIGYYSALQLHNLTTQPALNELVVTDRQIRPAIIKVKDINFRFIYHNHKHFFGAKKIWVDSYHKVLCSDLEKTFVDCLYKPEHAGGIVETGKALYKAKQSISYDRLLEYCKQFGSQAVIKRLGFLLELLKIENPIIDKLQKLKSNSYIQLDTEMPNKGKRLSRWSIQQNIDSETIQSSILT